MDSVSVIIPNFNHSAYIGEAIESALDQTYPCEVIVVDDCSTDNSREIIRKYPVHLIEMGKNVGLGAARNTGIIRSKGEWILPLDADDRIDPTFVEKTVGKGDIVGTGLLEFGDTYGAYMPPSKLEYKDFLEHNCIYACSLFRKKFWEEVGGYREGWAGYEDWDLWLRMAFKGAKITIIPEYLFFYRKHGKSMITDVRNNHEKHYKILKEANKEIYGLV